MALCKTVVRTVNYYSEDNDVFQKEKVYTNAYIEIVSIGGSKTEMEAVVAVYPDSGKEAEVWRKRYAFPPSVGENSANFFRQAYEYVKTLPEYADAEDC